MPFSLYTTFPLSCSGQTLVPFPSLIVAVGRAHQ